MRAIFALCALSFVVSPVRGITLTLSPADISGLPGQTIGWGFTLNNDTSRWLVVTSVQSTFTNAPFGISANNPAVEDYLSNWMVNNSFALAPNTSLTQAFSVALGEGLGAITIAAGASGSELGQIILTLSAFDDDPFVNPNAFAFVDPNPVSANASIAVASSAVPEPATWAIAAAGLLVLARRRLWIALGLSACLFAQLPGIDGVPADGTAPAPVIAPNTPVCQLSAQPLTVRKEGTTELLGDMVVICQGRAELNPRNSLTSTQAAPAVPRVNVRVRIPSPFTNRLVSGNLTDAVLVVEDDPRAQPCPAANVDASGVCAPLVRLDSGSTPKAALTTAGPVVALYQGVLTAPDTIDFLGVPFSWTDAKGNPRLLQQYLAIKSLSGTYSGQPLDVGLVRVFRVKNFRVNVASYPVNTQVMATVTMTNAASGVEISFPPYSASWSPNQAVVGQVNTGFNFNGAPVRSGDNTGNLGSLGLPVAACANRPLDPTNPSFRLQATEGYGVAARTRQAIVNNVFVEQDLSDTNYNTESGFFSSAWGSTNGLNRAGLADTGTRYRFLIKNVPAGAQIFAPVNVASNAGHALTMVDSDTTTSGASSPVNSFSALVATQSGLRELAARGADRLAVYEVTAANEYFTTAFSVPFHLAYTNGLPQGSVGAEWSMAPFLVENNPGITTTQPLPRFNSGVSQGSVFTVQACNACGSTLNTVIAVRDRIIYGPTGQPILAPAGQLFWVVRITNNGYNPVPGGTLTLTLTKQSGTGVVTSPAPVAFGAIPPGQFIDVPVTITADDFRARVRAVFSYTGGCFATTHTLNFQPLLI